MDHDPFPPTGQLPIGPPTGPPIAPAPAPPFATIQPPAGPPRSRRLVAAIAVALACCLTAFGTFRQWSGTTIESSLGSAASPTKAHVVTPSAQGANGLDVAAIADAVEPAVVNITANLANSQGEVAGTGIVIGASGIVLTNNHVIADTEDITVEFNGGKTHAGHVLGYDVADDVALLQVDGVSNLPTAKLGDSGAVKVGDPVVAIGNTLGRGGSPTATSGTVQDLDRQITISDESGADAETLSGLIESDASLQPGDSGGPLVNANAEVIGIDTAADSQGYGGVTQGSDTGFAIPIDHAEEVAHQIQSGDETDGVHIGERGLLGLQVQNAGGSGHGSGIPATSGVLIVGIGSDSPAGDAGMQEGDVITSIGGSSIGSTNDLNTTMAPYHPKDKVSVGWVDSAGDSHTAKITLIAGPPA